MPTPTYTPLANLTLAATTAIVTFGSLPSSYRDVILIVNGTASAEAGIFGRLNEDTLARYSTVRMFGVGSGSGTSDTAGGESNKFAIGVSSTSVRNTQIIQVLDYSATDKDKPILTRNSASAQAVNAHAARYQNTAAVSSISVFADGTTWSIGTTFNLYGIAS